MLKAFADENIPHALVHALRMRGMDVLTVQDAGLRSEGDPPLLDFAYRHERIILTNDQDFLAHAADLAARLEPFAPIVFWPHSKEQSGSLYRRSCNLRRTKHTAKRARTSFFFESRS